MKNLPLLSPYDTKSYTEKMKLHRASFSSHISRISPKDKSLVHEAVLRYRPNSDHYEDSWGYIIQATRYGGFKWYDAKKGNLIFFGRKSLTDATLVVPSFFASIEDLADTLQLISRVEDAPKVIVKNVHPDDIPDYLRLGFREYLPHENWTEQVRFDDQTFPQLIVDLPALFKARGKKYHQLRKTLNKKPNVSIRAYHTSDRDDVSVIFTARDGSVPDSSEKIEGMYYSSHIIYLAANISKYVIVHNTTGEIQGFTATSDISPENTTLVASIFKPGVKVASLWGIYQTLMKKYHEGFKMINLGGLETDGSYTFLSRNFRPFKQLRRTHLIYEPRKTSHLSS